MFVSITTIIPEIWLLVAAVTLLMLGVFYKGINFSVMILGAFIALVIATLVAAISVTFLWFIPSSTIAVLFVGGVAAFFSSFFLVFYVLD
ncbi:MAG TPA: hypothetical protein PKC68_06325, partial [Alphaproteobacteria bacterium]|nr:hypothetical protein [Alphaproteobacteria bacterium]